jgi:hypothetical protein
MHSLSGFSPIWGNHSFTPGRTDPGWASKGLRKAQDLYKEGIFMSSEEI